MKTRRRPRPKLPTPKVDPLSAEAWRMDEKLYAPIEANGRVRPTPME